jgi:aerobic carbon-monoxide dehydrogenase large subunit
MLIHGQSHGGIAQGIGQALSEECLYDRDTAQLLSGSLMDYAVPRADTLPRFRTEISEVPSTTNPLGMRGGSEGGITPGLAAVANGAKCAPVSPATQCARRRIRSAHRRSTIRASPRQS